MTNKLNKFAFIVLNFENYWNMLCSKNRAGKVNHSFVRRGVMFPKNTKKIFLYVTRPRKEIPEYADFVEHVTGAAKNLWKSLGHESLLGAYDEYQDIMLGRKKATFIRFKNLKQFLKPVTPEAWTQIIGKKNATMGMYITEKMSC